MAKVELIEFTGKGRNDERVHAANLLIFTKSTRLNMTPGLFEEVRGWDAAKRLAELEYMAGTIPSSWEFIDLTFLISGVSRAAAQQITRTRTASFAMQSQRVTDMSSAAVVNPFDPEAQAELHVAFDNFAAGAFVDYQALVDMGAALQDARGILPIGCECNLLAKYNLRSFVELVRKRSSLRAQGEYSDAVRDMKALVLDVWPWAETFFVSPNEKAIAMLEGVVAQLGMTTGKGPAWEIAKAIDLLRTGE